MRSRGSARTTLRAPPCLPAVTLADSTGEPGEALLADLRSVLPGAAIADPVALLGTTEDEMAPQLEPRLDELLR